MIKDTDFEVRMRGDEFNDHFVVTVEGEEVIGCIRDLDHLTKGGRLQTNFLGVTGEQVWGRLRRSHPSLPVFINERRKLLGKLEEAVIQRQETLLNLELARAEDNLAWGEIQAIAKELDPPKGRTVVGDWILSRGVDTYPGLGEDHAIEVRRAQFLGQPPA